MSWEFSITCDGCAHVIGSGKSKQAALNDLGNGRASKGKHYCAQCVEDAKWQPLWPDSPYQFKVERYTSFDGGEYTGKPEQCIVVRKYNAVVFDSGFCGRVKARNAFDAWCAERHELDRQLGHRWAQKRGAA